MQTKFNEDCSKEKSDFGSLLRFIFYSSPWPLIVNDAKDCGILLKKINK